MKKDNKQKEFVHKSKACEREKGFTLIEVIVGGMLITVLGAAIYGLQYIVRQNQLSVWQNYINVDEANSYVALVGTELRRATASENGSYTLDVAEDYNLAFFSDVDYDGEVERVRYYLNGNSFEKGVIEPVGTPVTYPPENEQTQVLTEFVRNDTYPVFYYYNEDYPNDTAGNPLPLSNRIAQAKLVRIYLIVNTKEDDPDGNYEIVSFVQPRTLKENL